MRDSCGNLLWRHDWQSARAPTLIHCVRRWGFVEKIIHNATCLCLWAFRVRTMRCIGYFCRRIVSFWFDPPSYTDIRALVGPVKNADTHCPWVAIRMGTQAREALPAHHGSRRGRAMVAILASPIPPLKPTHRLASAANHGASPQSLAGAHRVSCREGCRRL